MNHILGSKLDSAGMLILGMEGLRPGGALPVSQAAIRHAGSCEAARNRQRIGVALTNVVLYAIVVELVVKHIWEQERGTEAAYTHDVRGLFHELSSQTRHDVEILYNTCCSEYEAAARAGKQQLGTRAVAVEMASLDEALDWNQDAVKNLKYRLTPNGRSVPTGMFWDSDHCWVMPNTFPNFAIKLARWADSRSSREPLP